jgi:DNA polymerase
LFENNVQAAAADLLRFGITNMNNAGIPVVLTVYDEVLAETKTGSMTWEYGREIMERRPDWCPDLPVKVTGWQGRRYRKE